MHETGSTPPSPDTPSGDGTVAPADVPMLAARLSERMHGEVLTVRHAAYDDARRVWNGMIDKQPALIARCVDADDVVACVDLARENGLRTAVRGGGHNAAGTGTCDGGLVIDVGRMHGVDVDGSSGRVRAQAGARWGDLDRATQPYGLAVPGGVVSTTGIAGLTLSGGMSSQRRRDGMTIDSLLGADIVTADGRLRHADASEEADLFWALRGGGGNFGVVTAFEYQGRPLGPEVYAATLMYPFDGADALLAAWRDLVAGAPDTVTSEAVLWSFPEDPAIPPDLHGVPFVLIDAMYAGPAPDGEQTLRPFRRLATPLVDQSGTQPYVDIQQTLDGFFPAGQRCYWKAHYADALPDELLTLTVAEASERPSPKTAVVFRHLGGAISRVPADATAFGDRSAQFNVSVDATWDRPADDHMNIAWTRALWQAMKPFATGQTYFNFPGLLEERDQAVRTSYGPNYQRLVDVKTTYDPGNLFRLNQNIPPRGVS